MHQNSRRVAAVNRDGVNKKMTQFGIELIQLRQVVGVVEVVTTEIALDHRHSIGGESTCLVRTDSCSIAHCLTSVQVANQIVILQFCKEQHYSRHDKPKRQNFA